MPFNSNKMTAKEEYMAFCKQHDWVPIFHQPFWWDAVLDHWDVERLETDGAVAYLPYSSYKKWGFLFSRNPFLSPYSGLLFKENNYTVESKKALYELGSKFLQQFSISQYDLHPLLSKGMEGAKMKTTFLLELNKPLEEIEANFKPSLRRQLRKAEKKLTISEDRDSKAFYTIYTDSLKRQDASEIVPASLTASTFTLCLEKGIGHIFLAKDEEHNTHAAIWYVEDTHCAYYLLGGSAAAYLGSGAMGLLLKHCIQQAKTNGKTYFDFEGSEVAGVARFFATFGGERISYPVITSKTDPKLAILLKIKNKLKV